MEVESKKSMVEFLVSFIKLTIAVFGLCSILRFIICPIIIEILDRKTDLYKNERNKTPLEQRDLKTKGEKEDPFFLLSNIEGNKSKRNQRKGK